MLLLNIASQPAKIAVSSQAATLRQQTVAPQIELNTQAATVDIRQPQGTLEIDQSPCRASIGLKGMIAFAVDNAQLGRQTVMDFIARTAQEGERMASPETHEDAIRNITVEKNFPPAPGLTWAHIDAPSIHYQANPPEFTPQRGRVDLHYQPGFVQGDYTPGKVDIQVAQYPSIRMWTTEGRYDVSV